jgi:hypothetical protein
MSTFRDFGWALQRLKAGERVQRRGWNGKHMYLFLVPGSEFQVNRPPLLGIYREGTWVRYHSHIDMFTAQGYVVPWLASQADMIEEDWELATWPSDAAAPNPVLADHKELLKGTRYDPALDKRPTTDQALPVREHRG